MTKQTTIVVIGALRVKEEYLNISLGLFFLFLCKTYVVGTC